MGFNCGIVGLPNVGKSTIFNALTDAGAQVANYPFCTIEPNVGVVPLPDSRLDRLAAIFKSKKIVPTSVEFLDIAGLVSGASKGEGLGNQFLGHIRSVDAIAHVVRCFENSDIVHVSGSIDPKRDIEVINTELMLADLQTVTQRIDKIKKVAQSGNAEAQAVLEILCKVEQTLNEGHGARRAGLTASEAEKVQDLGLITAKPMLYVLNVDEANLSGESELVRQVKSQARSEDASCIILCGNIESEIIQMPPEERTAFLKDYGLTESGLDRLIRAGYDLLNLITFFTAGEKEVRAWTVTKGSLAPQAAGKIHSDFEKGFIRAEVYPFTEIDRLGSESKVREAGQFRTEGRDYLVQDGDVMFFRFNV